MTQPRAGSDTAPPCPSLVHLDLVPTALWLCDAQGRVLQANRRAQACFPHGAQPGETLLESVQRLGVSGTSAARLRAGMAALLDEGTPIEDLELELNREGERRWLVLNAAPDSNAETTPSIVYTLQDVTAQHGIEPKHLQSREHLQAIVATTPECVKVVSHDGRLLQMNPAGLCMVGAGLASDVEGGRVLDLIAPEFRIAWQACHQRVCTGERLSWEFDIIGLNGIRRHMETHAVPLRLPDGTTAQLAVTRDISEHKRNRQALLASEKHWRELLKALPTAVYTTDAQGVITFYNAAAAALWGGEPEGDGAQWYAAARLLDEQGEPLSLSACPMAVALRTRTARHHQEIIVERQDGTRVPVAAYPTPLFDEQGQLTGAINMLVDISQHKQAQRQQNLLIDELNHRVKNTLATVQSLATLTLMKSDSLGGFRETFEPRLIALSRAHDLLTQTHWQGASLQALLQEIVAPYRLDDTGRVSLNGPDVHLPPQTSLSLAMAFHEMAVNASKYGALSTAKGHVAIAWHLTEEADAPARQRLDLTWIERAGPPVVAPQRRGFGTRLIEATVIKELKGRVAFLYGEHGLDCQIHIPLFQDVTHE